MVVFKRKSGWNTVFCLLWVQLWSETKCYSEMLHIINKGSGLHWKHDIKRQIISARHVHSTLDCTINTQYDIFLIGEARNVNEPTKRLINTLYLMKKEMCHLQKKNVIAK